MSKDFKVTLKYDRLSRRYTVVQIVGSDVSITIKGDRKTVRYELGEPRVVHAGSVLSEAEATRLGQYAVLTIR
mgnify:CR=1 FL=1